MPEFPGKHRTPLYKKANGLIYFRLHLSYEFEQASCNPLNASSVAATMDLACLSIGDNVYVRPSYWSTRGWKPRFYQGVVQEPAGSNKWLVTFKDGTYEVHSNELALNEKDVLELEEKFQSNGDVTDVAADADDINTDDEVTFQNTSSPDADLGVNEAGAVPDQVKLHEQMLAIKAKMLRLGGKSPYPDTPPNKVYSIPIMQIHNVFNRSVGRLKDFCKSNNVELTGKALVL